MKERLYIALQTLGDHQKMLPKRQSLNGALLKESIARDNDILKLTNIVYWVELSVIFRNINKVTGTTQLIFNKISSELRDVENMREN